MNLRTSLLLVVASTSIASAGTTISGGNVINQTWTAAGSPYVVQGDVIVPAGSTLTIEPGTVVQAAAGDSQGSGIDRTRVELTVRGALVANGTAALPIVFEGQTHGAGGWQGMLIEASASAASVHHATFRDAQIGLRSDLPGAALSNLTATRSSYGFWLTGSTQVIDDITATDNGVGLRIEGGTLTLSRVTLMKNGMMLRDATTTLDRVTSVGTPGISITQSGGTITADRVTIDGGERGMDIYQGRMSITNCAIGNVGWGFKATTGTVTATNCTLYATQYGVGAMTNSTVDLVNDIIVSSSYGISSAQSTVTISYSNVWGGAISSDVHRGNGMLSANPQFVSATDPHLQASSVCIDTGTPGVTHDRDGLARPFDGDGLGGAAWDIGAYEFGASAACGNGSVEPGETCDDGADNGTNGHCKVDCSGAGPHSSTCGDGTVQSTLEECDDGNLIAGDGCSPTCTTEPGGHGKDDGGGDPGQQVGGCCDAGHSGRDASVILVCVVAVVLRRRRSAAA